jgi:hypothetical protein
MKKFLLIVFVVILAIGSVFAQQGQRDPAARLQREMDGLTSALGLSKDQVEKITPIVADSQKKASEMYAKMREESGGDVDRSKMRTEGMKMRSETDKKIKTLVTAEQGVKLDAYRKQKDEERAKRMQEHQ